MKKTSVSHLSSSFLFIPFLAMIALLIGVATYKTASDLGYAQASRGNFHGTIVYAPPVDTNEKPMINVLGDAANKRIEINLSAQRVYAFEGGSAVREFVVSTGKWGATPTGDFTIQRKVRSQTMSGGNKALGTSYYLPGVQWVQYFGNSSIPWSRGFSFHGTYWHNNFGHPMSHGCINMKTPEAQWLYDWAPMGTSVKIYGATPNS